MDARKTCRTCLAPAENMYSIYQTIGDKDDVRLLEVIEAVSGLELNMSVSLPESVCAHCYKDLVYIHQFSVNCKVSDAALVNIFTVENIIEGDCDVPDEHLSLSSANEGKSDANSSCSLEFNTAKKRAVLPIRMESRRKNISNVRKGSSQVRNDKNAATESKGLINQISSSSNALAKANCIEDDKPSDSMKKVKMNGNFVCKFCKKSCNFEDQFAKHMQLHDPNRKFECDICKYRFNSSSCFSAHKNTHIEHRSFVCTICDRSFRKGKELGSHMIWHSTEKPFECEVCHKRCKTMRNLKTHMYVHTKEKPYVCEFCGRGFNQASHVKTHRRTHTGERPYVCEICGRGFNQAPHLQTHRLRHTVVRPYVCKNCPLHFSTKVNCTKHELACKAHHHKSLVGICYENNNDDPWDHILAD